MTPREAAEFKGAVEAREVIPGTGIFTWPARKNSWTEAAGRHLKRGFSELQNSSESAAKNELMMSRNDRSERVKPR